MNVLNKYIGKTKCVVLSKFDSKANYIINCSFPPEDSNEDPYLCLSHELRQQVSSN